VPLPQSATIVHSNFGDLTSLLTADFSGVLELSLCLRPFEAKAVRVATLKAAEKMKFFMVGRNKKN
jgi:hypothetical protein